MNRVYQVVWNKSKGVWQAASELSRSGHGSTSGAVSVAGSLKTISAGALLLIALPLHASNLPSGGTVVGGQGSINSSDKTLTVSQSSQNMAIDWQDFSIAEGHTVNFHQPNAQAAALNRVTGNNVSEIRGALNANGRVFLVNPNGVMFSPTARVDVGALVTSTLDISTEDFMAGKYHFEGTSANAIVNQGNITTSEGGVVAMIAAEIINTGSITTPQGSTLMGAGSKVTLDLGGPVKIEVEEALLDTYIEQGGAIRADGGLVYLTAKAAGDLASSVINHTGVTEARTLATGEDGQIMLMGDMDSGQVQVAGTLDASAPNGGDGGFIETSAANVSILDEATVTTKAVSGETGEWLIDPTDIEIVAGSGGDFSDNTSGSSSIGVDTLVSNLANNNITVQTPTDGSEDGNITVSADIVWDTDTRLTLDAINEIYVNATIENTNTTGGGVYFDTTPTGSQMMGDLTDHVVFSNEGKVVIHNIDQLQWVSRALAGTYELGSDIDASSTSIWNDGKGFDPIKRTVMVEDEMGGMPGMEMEEILGFSGRFDGRGHIIDALTINRPEENYVGLFGQSRSNSSSPEIKNVTLTNVSVTGKDRTGGLVGQGNQTTIANVSVTGVVEGNDYAGGLAGELRTASLTTSYSNVSVVGKDRIGGLAGYIYSTNIENSYAIDSVSGTNRVGGLVGMISHGGIINSYASNSVIASGDGADVGGLIGNINAGSPNVSQSYYNNQANTGKMADSGDYGKTKSEIMTSANNSWDDSIWADSIFGADYAGYAIDIIELPVLKALFTPSETLFEGGMGEQGNPYTVTNWNQLQNMNYSPDVLRGDYHFVLSNDLSTNTVGYSEQASTGANGGQGWTPIGSSTHKFTGKFDGSGHFLDSFTINRSAEDYVGLFGFTDAATLKNLAVTNANITGNYYVGSIAGGLDGNLSNSYSSGSEIKGIAAVGGVVGSIYEGNISEVYSSDSVTGERNTGGLVGLSQSDKPSTISNSYSTSNIIVASKTDTSNSNVGGLVGINNQTITNSYASGTITGAPASNVGGLIGSGGGIVAHSYWNTETSDLDSSAGGEGKTTAEMQSLSTFKDGSAGWSIEEDANLETGSPILAWTLGRDSSVWVIGTKTSGSTDGGGTSGDGNSGGGNTGGGDTGDGNTGGGDAGGGNTGGGDAGGGNTGGGDAGGGNTGGGDTGGGNTGGGDAGDGNTGGGNAGDGNTGGGDAGDGNTGGGNAGDGNTGGGDAGDGNTGGGNAGGGNTGGGDTGGDNTDLANRASRAIAALQQSNTRMTGNNRPGADVGTNAFPSMTSQEGRQISGGLELVATDGATTTEQTSNRDQSGPLAVFVVDGGMRFNDTQNSDEQ